MQCNQYMWYQVLNIKVMLLIYPPTDSYSLNSLHFWIKIHLKSSLINLELVIELKSHTHQWSPLLNQKLVTGPKSVTIRLVTSPLFWTNNSSLDRSSYNYLWYTWCMNATNNTNEILISTSNSNTRLRFLYEPKHRRQTEVSDSSLIPSLNQ